MFCMLHVCLKNLHSKCLHFIKEGLLKNQRVTSQACRTAKQEKVDRQCLGLESGDWVHPGMGPSLPRLFLSPFPPHREDSVLGVMPVQPHTSPRSRGQAPFLLTGCVDRLSSSFLLGKLRGSAEPQGREMRGKVPSSTG